MTRARQPWACPECGRRDDPRFHACSLVLPDADEAIAPPPQSPAGRVPD